ncbi:MAG: hypothetical protein HKL92_08385 [Candidatus Eremiobacteraeota bacterium]|nr:hypothetical protein [Candidatus Eremiobacteraeota bacterium]NNM93345.1 hypothetical protein [Candidatus Eremiobacteraeota bacterium]NNM99736.1 hypothetical protein [Candidatus Eremiobacteraeota bacterium]
MTDSLHQHAESPSNQPDDNELGKALLVGVLGGVLSAVGYVIYRRLPDEQRDRLHDQVRTVVSARINDIRQNFNL